MELMMSWMVAVSKLCINNISNVKMTHVSKKD
jgi:hypothetical protein